MVEIVISVAAKIAEYLVAPVGRTFRYVWNYKTNLENLKNEVEKLEAERDTVRLKIKPGEDPFPVVKLWQEKANRIIDDVSEVVGDNPEQANIQCCKGFSCPNLINRYQLSKKAGKLKSDVVDLEQEAAKFKEVSYPTILEEPWLRSSKGYDAFESRTSILKNIIDALRDPDVNMVGIYGMGGIGKTTLAKKVARHTKQDNLFHVIVFVEVSKTTDVKKIQQDIGEKLGLSFDDKSEGKRASALYDKLKKEVTVSERADYSEEKKKEGANNSGEEKKEKKFLLILDNIWGKIDLERVGIPLGDDCKGLKLLLTTRNFHVLTNQMGSRCNFPVDTLEEAEAWSLFKNTAGTCIDHPDLKSIAPKVAKECGNMPLAIVTIANALKNKGESTWSNALDELKNPSSESIEGITKEVYTSIKLSYDYLDSEELKKIFLLCSRMGRPYDASIRDLFRYGLGLGFFKRFNTLEKAQCRVEDLIKKLKDNSLLLDAPNETSESHSYSISDSERFAMHDVICDVARSIAFEKGNVCIVIDDVISCSWAKHNILENCNSITLHNIGELPKDLKLVLPQLKFFYMKPKNTFSRITDDFFTDISSLLVLHLIEMNLSPLPTSLSHLVNLQTLCLDACKLGDIADVGKLEKLEFLSFCGSEIGELPKEMCQLTSIRLLDLTNCSKLEIIPPNLLSCFTQLEALYMYNTLIRWEVRRLNIGRILEELKHLRGCLTTLEISIPNVKMSEGLLSLHLKRYKISIDRDRISPPMNSRTLRVKLDTNDNANEVISQLEGIKQLELGCADRRYGFTDSGSRDDSESRDDDSESGDDSESRYDDSESRDDESEGIKQLELVADSRNDSESRDDDSKQSVSLDALFSLESLSLEHLNFEKICNVPLAAESFCQLRTITVYRCDKLTNIFSFSIDRVLPKLQEIQVSWCENMEGIFAIEREDDVNNTELIHEIKFSQLCSVTLTDLPQLKSFCHRVKTTSQLQLTSSPNDGEIISEDTIDIPKSLFNKKVVFPNLNSLNVFRCGNLKGLFSSSMVNSFVQLQYLSIYSCSLLEEMVFMEELKEEERKDTQFPSLKRMTICDCPNFKGFISNDKIGFPSLKAMGIILCPKFKDFIFNDKVAVPNIEKLTIQQMDNLEKIWHDQLVKDSFCKLKSLGVYYCERLLNVFPSNIYGRLLSLESLEVRECYSLQEIFDFQESSIYDSQMQIMLSFESLQRLEVSSCGSQKNLFSASILGKEGVVMEEAPARFLFPKLTSLVLDHLPQLRSFSSGGHKVEDPVLKMSDLSHSGIHGTDEKGQMQQPFFLSLDVEIGFPSLKEMGIMRCPKLKELIFNDKVAVPNLEKLTIKKMDNLEKIWHNQLVNDSFGKLKSLEVKGCKKLLNVFPSNICGRLLSLESLQVGGCGSLEGIFDLRELSICDTRIMLSFESLQRLEVSRCFSLKNLFSPSILVKEGVVMEEAPARFLFPKLTSLVLDIKWTQLRSFYPGGHKVEGPVLKALHLVHCDEDDDDTSEDDKHLVHCDEDDDDTSEDDDDTGEDDDDTGEVDDDTGEVDREGDDTGKVDEDDDDTGEVDGEGDDTGKVDEDDDDTGEDDEEGQMQQPFFLSLVEQAFPCLERLSLDGEQVMMLCRGQFPESLFDRIKILQVNNDQSIFPFGIIQRFQNLEELSLSRSHYKEIFPHGEDQTQTKIKTLYLFFLYDLKYIWKQNSKLDLIIQHLEVLKVEECHSLINLMQPPTSFQNPSTSFQSLTSLGVDSSNSLVNMGTSSVAKSLVQLTEMRISSCNKITEVIGYHGDLIEDEIIFRKLKSLMLEHLPSLTSFCSSNFTLKFPSLETLTVEECPKMKIFSQGDLTTQKLQRVEIDWESVELRTDFDLNTSIQQSYKKAKASRMRISRMQISTKDDGASSSHHLE